MNKYNHNTGKWYRTPPRWYKTLYWVYHIMADLILVIVCLLLSMYVLGHVVAAMIR